MERARLAMTQPDPPAPLHRGGECHVVDELAAHGLDPPNPLQGGTAHQDRATRRGRRATQRVVHAGKGIEKLEEEDEGGNQRSLGQAGAIQLHHLRYHVQSGLSRVL